MNEPGKEPNIRAETVPAASQYVVFDKSGNPWGPFDDAKAAHDWAEKKWPGMDAADTADGWVVVLLNKPDEA